jgi:bifunctional enzyme CysN/CysC
MSARDGDNVTTRSSRTPWYAGPALLEFLETVEVGNGQDDDRPFRFPVQLVVRAAQDFRGYAGQVVSGVVRVGDVVTAWPSGRETTVRHIVTWGSPRTEAGPGRPVVLEVDPPIDLGRGDILASGSLAVTTRFEADVVWMDERPLETGRVYMLRQGTRSVTAQVNVSLALNEIGSVIVTTSAPLAVDRYVDGRATGSFILIDPVSAFTCGAGLISRVHVEDGARPYLGAARTLARVARLAPSEDEATTAVEWALSEALK